MFQTLLATVIHTQFQRSQRCVCVCVCVYVCVCIHTDTHTHTHTLFLLWRCRPTRTMISFVGFLDLTQRRITVGRTPLDERSARRRDLHLTTHNTHKRQTSMPPTGFDPTISGGERQQTYALHRTATGIRVYMPILFTI